MMRKHLAIALFTILASCSPQPAEESAPTPGTETAAPSQTVAPNEEAATAALKEITQAQTDYFQRNRRYALDYDELISARFLRSEPRADELGYDIRMRPAADAASYTVTATPVGPANSGASARRMSANQTGEIIFE